MLDIRKIKQKIEDQNPVILNLTNNVTNNFMANTLLALGASPIMSNDLDDAKELLSIANGICVNIGTLDQSFIRLACHIALENNKQKPLILDPVGSGASKIRTQTSQKLVPYSTVIRGNLSEILSLSQQNVLTKGVDNSIELDDFTPIIQFSRTVNSIIAVSGQKDFIGNKNNYIVSDFGHPIMTKITGMGCVLSSVIASFCAVEENYFLATMAACFYYSLCGELAYKKSSSLGFFQNHFIETLHDPDYNYIQQKINLLKED